MGKARVLIVDDSQTTLLFMEKMVRDVGHFPLKNTSGEQAIEYLTKYEVDIVLIDFYLNDMKATEVIRTIKNGIRPNLPFVIISADSSEATILEGLTSGAEEFLTKPINREILKFRMNNIIEKKSKEKVLTELTQKLEKEKKLLTRYFPSDLVEEILNESINPEIGGLSVTASILFFDLRGSTSIAEKKHPAEFADFLSLLFTDIMDLIYGHKGSVNKLLGDGILATFGCPVFSDFDTENCLKCALAIIEYFETFKNISKVFVDDEVSCGVGIATGRVFAGNVGSYRRMEYTVIGEAVNIASRLESATKEVGEKILVDGNTVRAIKENIFHFEKVDKNTVRGKKGEIEIYSLRGLKSE
ncbi:MAG: adenylate/guanylate cyclase domain-containing response regulator [Leptospiraceae bacterium]|nr:adenylate/guanylate cyclase domain-containing response regulator [Leptospiraceae bacterium]MCP5510663.1 adenylate/guanylate cyclase domain-containing response regulator [Leptospiraceae bacterium]